MARSAGDDEGFFVPMLAGAMSLEHESRITSMIIDLRTGKFVCNIRSSAIGRDRMLYYVIFIAGNEAQTDDSAVKGLSAEIGNAINDHNKHKNTRIAIMSNEVFIDVTDTSTLDQIWQEEYEYNPPVDTGTGYSELDLCTFVDKELIKQVHIWDEEGELVLGAHGKWINSQTRESAVQECKIKLSGGTHLVHYTVRLKSKHGSKVQIEPRGNINFIAGHTYAIKLNYGEQLQASEYSSWIEDTSTHKIELGCEKRVNYQCPPTTSW
jgi:hypothetical protein